MSTSGISSTSFAAYNTQDVQNEFQEFQQEFQQLGQDLQSGNLSAAQQDFVTLQSLTPQSSSTSSTTSTRSNNPIEQAFNQLSQDLQSGNLSAAQQDYSQIEQDFQSQAHSAEGHHHHHHGGSDSGQSQISQLFSELGQELQSGNLSGAQQVFSTLQQDFEQFGQSSNQTSGQQSTSSGTVSVNA